MADAARKQGSSNFAVACSLLSQYIKEKGGAADLGLGIAQVASKGKSESFQPPITMSLLPGADVSGGQDSERESEGEVVSQENPMDLFPQRTGFLTSPSLDSRVAQKSQLTIFYGGKVLVFDNFPAEKAKDLMQLASKGSSTADNLTCEPPSPLAEAVTSSRLCSHPKNSTLVPKAARNPVVPQPNLSKPAQPNLSDLPIARKVSLQRFLEKRKDRIYARAPYQMTPSPQVATSINQEDIKSWLGLGHHFATPGLSLSSEYNR
ncbi:protein TIFY 10a-like [Curcuma longa]|uniref:protein TIFY 10a-like n=1 Tax=Curcuma longa TaxID=136217 RepID=UPI003D9F4A9A